MTMAQIALTDYAHETETTRAAAERALSEGYALGKYADPTEDAREGLTADEAVAVAREDASLVYVVRATVSRRMKRRLEDSMSTNEGRTVKMGSARKGYRFRATPAEAAVLVPEFRMMERAEEFATSGVEVARRGGRHPHEIVGTMLRDEVG